MKLPEFIKPYMKWSFESTQKVKNLFKELQNDFPEIEPKITFSSIDESIIREEDIEGNELKAVYVLKSSQDGKKFEFKHSLKENDEVDSIRTAAWAQLEAWQYSIKESKLNKSIEELN